MGRNDIEKRHFKFKYRSPVINRDVTILLDVLFEELQYSGMVEKPIRNEMLLTEGDDLYVRIPNENGILGDKLTAFAPHTTGVPFGIEKELEIIKQLFDCGALFDVMTDFLEVRAAYKRIVRSELGYRGLSVSPEDVLADTISGSLCIASRGNPEGDYAFYMDGISRIRNHIIGGRFGGELAGASAGRVLYLAASLLTGTDAVIRIEDGLAYSGQTPEIEKPRRFSYLKVVDPVAYGYLVEATRLLQGTGLI